MKQTSSNTTNIKVIDIGAAKHVFPVTHCFVPTSNYNVPSCTASTVNIFTSPVIYSLEL